MQKQHDLAAEDRQLVYARGREFNSPRLRAPDRFEDLRRIVRDYGSGFALTLGHDFVSFEGSFYVSEDPQIRAG
jgi:hypothetical protein